MSDETIDEKWGISDSPLEIRSALKDVYDDLVDTEKLFPNNYSLFSVGLVYGLLHKKEHDVKPTAPFIKLFAIGDTAAKNVIDLVYYVLDDGRDKNEIWNQMLSMADGGVYELYRIYKDNKNFRIPYMVRDAEEIWSKRARDLYNISLPE